MTVINYCEDGEEGEAVVLNRPLREVLVALGLDPDDVISPWLTAVLAAATYAPIVHNHDALYQPLLVRAAVGVTTASLADDATENGTVALGKSFELYKVVADRFCRVRLYQTAAARTADASRPIGTDPETAAGVIADFVIDATSGLTILTQPRVSGENHDATVVSTIYYAITNMSGSTSTVTVTFTRAVTEQ